MHHFLFSFPRARAASRQVSECITMMVTMALWKGLLSWLLGLCPTPATPSITAQWQRLLALLLPRTGQSEVPWNARPLPKCCPLSCFIWSQQKSTYAPVFGMGCVWEMQRWRRMCSCVKVCIRVSCLLRVFSRKACCCWAHRCFFQKWGSVEKSWEKEGSQVHVLEAHRVWVAPRCPLNKITAFTRPLLFLWECNTINKRGGCFFFSLGKKKKTSIETLAHSFPNNSLPHKEFT